MQGHCKVEEDPVPIYYPFLANPPEFMHPSSFLPFPPMVKEQAPEPTMAAQAAPTEKLKEEFIERPEAKADKRSCLLWTREQNKTYLSFLQEHLHLYDDPASSKKLCMNRMMSQFIKTRTSVQCRSHHQKMLTYHQNQRGIIEYVKRLLASEDKCIKQDGKTVLRLRRKKCEVKRNKEALREQSTSFTKAQSGFTDRVMRGLSPQDPFIIIRREEIHRNDFELFGAVKKEEE